MASILAKTDGTPITVQPDGHVWGRKESLKQWLASGETRESWHGLTRVIQVPGTPAWEFEYVKKEKLKEVLSAHIANAEQDGEIIINDEPDKPRQLLGIDY